MYYDLALFSVLIAAGYWGGYFVRQTSTRGYGAMQLAAAAAAGMGLWSRKTAGAEALGFAGAIGLGAGACLVVLGPMSRAFARRMAMAERFRTANALLSIAEVLAPGSGAADEKALVAAMRRIRDGHIEQTVEALSIAKRNAPADARLVIDERIAMLYLAAYRWDEAIAHAEATLIAQQSDDSDDRTKRSDAVEEIGPAGLRRALGVAPPVWVELLGAYGYTGDLGRAAQMLTRLEEVCARREGAAIWVHRGRMMFLALAGRVSAVQSLLDPRKSRHMSRAARAYWTAVAHERKGDAQAATAAYIKAKSQSRGRPRVLIERALERMPDIRSIEIPPVASEVIARVEASPAPEIGMDFRPRRAWATLGLLAAILTVSAAVSLRLGALSDLDHLVRAGAVSRELVYSGHWWRMASYALVHASGLHLWVNVIGLWTFGRWSENAFGSTRTLAIFAIAALGGAVGHLWAAPVDAAAGGSGAILGLLGAALVELAVHGQRHRTAENYGFWASVAVVILGQLGLDAIAGTADHWVQVGGFVTGAAMGLWMSPNARRRWSLHGARAIAFVYVLTCAVAATHLAMT
jgi:membrane associated rhomboid family serine protease